MSIFITTVVVVWVYMTLWYVYSQVVKRNDVADIAWGIGFVLVAVFSLANSDVINSKKLVLLGMVTLWGLRLALHISARHRGKTEDGRYQKMRESWRFPALKLT